MTRRAHMATFPARGHVLEAALRSLEKQVDEIHLVLNEYDEIPASLAGIRRLNPILPDRDYKDVGKFVPAPAPEDLVFLVDDDLVYSGSYCDWLIERAGGVEGAPAVFGLHATLYRGPEPAHARDRRLLHYAAPLRRSRVVDQLGTGTVLARGRDLPPLDYMLGSRMFVDVRFAKWCFERGAAQISLARPRGMVRSLRHGGGTIYRDFTKESPSHVMAEILSYAGRGRGVGDRLGPPLGLWRMLLGGPASRAGPPSTTVTSKR